ncbi:MAG: NAD(P)H-dependent oxidoreductase [Oscillospiraceae bacterium]|nr:NAD(P)H-dependent oxidoreductase [Oscillospiraceae bacterium]
MIKLCRFAVRIYFMIWLACLVLPGVLAEYRPFELLFRAGGYLSNGLMIVCAGIFILTLIPRKQKPVAESDKTTLILHDLEPEAARNVFSNIPNAVFVCASAKMAACKGYYDCWVRTPGECALHDGFEGLGQRIANCDDFIIVSKNLYGGYSREIKNALDRSISFALPYFKFRSREVHHQERVNKTGGMTVYIYNSESITDFDKNSIRDIAKANRLNLNRRQPAVIFVNSITEIKEVVA